MRKTLSALAAHVLRAHVDHAVHAQQRADGGGGHAVLAGAGFGDDAPLAHAPGQQRLAQAVVDLVRAGVQQVLALQVDARAAQLLGQPPRRMRAASDGRRSCAAGRPVPPGRRGLRAPRDRPAPVPRSAPSAFRERSGRRRGRSGLRDPAAAVMRPAPPGPPCRNAFIFSWSFLPGADSMREHASTPQGRTRATACATLEASSPPARMIAGRDWPATHAASAQSKVLPEPPYASPDGPSSTSACGSGAFRAFGRARCLSHCASAAV